MFTGIVEAIGEVVDIHKEGTNITFTLTCPFTNELKIDQSLSHNGVCLTVIAIEGNLYSVTAIDETLKKTNLGKLEVGSKVNLNVVCLLMVVLMGILYKGTSTKLVV
jgi:riboflavin synthase